MSATLKMISSTGSKAFAQVEYNMMDPETGDMPLTSDLWRTQHGFTTKEGEKKWHDSKSEEVYEKIKRIEERDESESQEVFSSEVILNEILGAKSGHVRGRGSGNKATRKGTTSTPHSELVTQLKTTVSELTDQPKDNQTQPKDNQALLKENQENGVDDGINSSVARTSPSTTKLLRVQ